MKDKLIENFEAADLGYGDFFSHKDVDAWLGLEYPDFRRIHSQQELQEAIKRHNLARLSAFEGLRDHLLQERQMYLISVRGEGYRIARPSEQTGHAVKKGMDKVNKSLRQLTKDVEHVNTKMLTASERAENSSVRARLNGLQSLMGKRADLLPEK